MNDQSKPVVWLDVLEGQVLRFGDLAHLLADAMFPEVGPEDDRSGFGFSMVNWENVLADGVREGGLRVLDPLTLTPHTFPRGQALERAVVLPQALEDWLRSIGAGVGVRVVQIQQRTQAAASNASGLAMTRVGLIGAHSRQWPTIERDLKDAGKNELASVAKVGQRGWDEERALEWARSRGKLQENHLTRQGSALPSVEDLPRRTHRMR